MSEAVAPSEFVNEQNENAKAAQDNNDNKINSEQDRIDLERDCAILENDDDDDESSESENESDSDSELSKSEDE